MLTNFIINENNFLRTEEKKMKAHRIIAIIVGVLFIVASATTLASGLFFEVIHSPDYLNVVSANETQMVVGVLFIFAATAAVVAIPVMMFPILRKQNEGLALGCVCARIFEGFFLAFSAVSLLAILSLSHEFVNTLSPVASYFQTTGTLLLSVFEWSSLSLDIPFALSALIFNYLLYKSNLVPRWLSGWGLLGGALWLAISPLGLFSITEVSYFAAPIGIQEMALAVWLIVKGFNASSPTLA